MQAQWKRIAFRNASRSIVRTRAFWRAATPVCKKWSIKMSMRDVILPIKVRGSLYIVFNLQSVVFVAIACAIAHHNCI